jgi:hypothetical protein
MVSHTKGKADFAGVCDATTRTLHLCYYYGDGLKEYEVDGTNITHGRDEI